MSTQELEAFAMNQRDRFETWATKANFDVERYGISPGYQDTHTDDAWVAWQAAEAAAIERCAKICDEWQRQYFLEECCDLAQDNALKSVASAIRALLPKEES